MSTINPYWLLLDEGAGGGGAGGTVYADNFNRADSATLGTPWVTTAGGILLTGNKADSAGQSGTSYYDETFTVDQWAEGDVASIGTGSLGPAVRITPSPLSCYFLWIDGAGSALQLWRRVDPAFDQLGSSVSIASTSGRARIQVAGSTIKAFWNNVELISVTDTAVTAGKPGITGAGPSGATCTLDNFRCGDLPYTP